jgi:hypothetical protein
MKKRGLFPIIRFLLFVLSPIIRWFYDDEGYGIKFAADTWRVRLVNSFREYSTNYSTSLMFATPFAAGAIREQTHYSAYQYLSK